MDGLDSILNNPQQTHTQTGDIDDSSDESDSSDEDEPPKPSKRTPSDPYAQLDDETAAALRAEDEQIASLSSMLGISNPKKKQKLSKEYYKEGYGGDFLDFLEGLEDGVLTKPVESDDENDSDDSDVPEELVPMKEPKQSDSDDSSESDSDDGSSQEEEDQDNEVTYRPSVGEDIYGRRLESANDKNVPAKYIPPHLRKTLTSPEGQQPPSSTVNPALRSVSETQSDNTVLKRQINGIINRLSENTTTGVTSQLTALANDHPRHDYQGCILSNLLRCCVSPTQLQTNMISLYVGVVAAIDIQSKESILGCYLVETIGLKYIAALEATNNPANDLDSEPSDKTTSNLCLLLCYLYNYRVIHSQFLYNIIRHHIQHLAGATAGVETTVELLLLILQHTGTALRNDDPSSLKDVVLLIQKRAVELLSRDTNNNNKSDGTTPNSNTSSRIRCMVQALQDLKNNKRKSELQNDPIQITIKKQLQFLGKCKSMTADNGGGTSHANYTNLKISLQDLLDIILWRE